MSAIALRITHPEIWPWSVAFSPDGRLVAVAGNHAILVWDTKTGSLVKQFKQGNVTEMVFSPDGTLLAAADEVEGVCLWDVASTKLRINFGRLGAESLAFSPDGRFLACGTNKTDKVTLFDANDGTKVAEFGGNKDWGVSLAFNSTGTLLACGTYWDDGATRVWRVSDGRLLYTLDKKTPGVAEGVRDLAVSPHDSQLIAIDHSAVRFWDVSSGTEILSKRIGLPRSAVGDSWVTIGPSRRLFATMLSETTTDEHRDSRSIGIFDLESGSLLTKLQDGDDFEPMAIAFGPTESQFASFDDNRRLIVWQL